MTDQFNRWKTGGTQEPAGPSFITAPDGQDIAYTYDELGRVSTVTGGTSYDMTASVTYDKVGRVKEVTRGFSNDATKTVYVYDEAGRTTQIRHETIVGPSTLHQTTYTWNINNTLASRVETDNFGLTVATVAFTYDNRDRLIREERQQAYNGGSAATAYDYLYGYDQLGNRRWRIDAATSERPAYYYSYVYDTDFDPDELDWPTRNNRLLKYEVRKDSASGDLLRTVSYTYYKTGHASNITVKDWYVDSSTTPGSAADYDWYHDLALYYFTNGSLRLAMNDKWKVDVDGGTGQSTITDYTSMTAREFRYDGGIARYLAVDYDTNNEPTDPGEWTLVGAPMLTDYAGSTPLTDSSITYSSSYSATAQTRYFAGNGRQTLGSGGSVTDLRYFHGDLNDSGTMTTDESASAIATTAYTAFGEAVPAIGSPSRPFDSATLGSRYLYVGGFGVEAGMLVVGGPNLQLPDLALVRDDHLWYEPGTGRNVNWTPFSDNGYLSDIHTMTVPTGGPAGGGPWDGIRKLDKLIEKLFQTIRRHPVGERLYWLKALRTALKERNKLFKNIGPGGGPLTVIGAIFTCLQIAKEYQPEVSDALDDWGNNFWGNRVRRSQRGIQNPIRPGDLPGTISRRPDFATERMVAVASRNSMELASFR